MWICSMIEVGWGSCLSPWSECILQASRRCRGFRGFWNSMCGHMFTTMLGDRVCGFFPWIATNRWLSRWHADFSTFPTITRESMRRVRMVKLSTPVSAGDLRTHRAFATATRSALSPRQSIRSSGFWLSDTCFSPPIARVKSGPGECTTPLTGSRLQIVRSGRQSRSSRMGLAASKGRPSRCLWLNRWMCGFFPSCRRKKPKDQRARCNASHIKSSSCLFL